MTRHLKFLCSRLPTGLLLLLILTAALAQPARSAAMDGRILFIHSYYQGYPWSAELSRGVSDVLKNRPGLQYLQDYVDIADMAEQGYQRLLVSLLAAKYRHVLPDVVIVSTAATLEFVLKYRDVIFPGVSVAYCGLEIPWDRLLYTEPDLRGLITWPDLDGTMSLIRRLQPQVDTLYVISDNSPAAGMLEGIFRKSAGTMKFRILKNWMYQELADSLRGLPPNSACLILSMARDASGNALDPQQISAVLNSSRVPVYTISGLYTGLGTVGGSLFDAYSQGTGVANLALRMLAADSIDEVGAAYLGLPRPVLDADVLARFGLSIEDEQAILLNRKPHLYEEYPALVYGVAAGLGMLLIGLLAMLILFLHRRRTMRDLGVAEQRYRAMFENAVEGIFQLVPGQGFVSVNTSLARMLGYDSAEEMLLAGARPENILLRPEDSVALFSRLQKHTVVPGTDIQARRTDGQTLTLWVTMRATHDTAGNIDFIEGRAMDVTEERRVREELETNRERLRLALETSSDGIWDYNALTRETYYSPRYFTMLGYAPGGFEPSPESWAEMLHPDDRDEVMIRTAEFESGNMNTDTFDTMYRLKSADGSYRWILSRSKAVRRTSSGLAMRIIGITMDITELKKTQEELAELNRDLENRVETRTGELKEANRALAESLEALNRMQDNLVQSEKLAALGGLVAGVAHEINTPVGLGVTASSWLAERTEEIGKLMAEGAMKRSDLEKYLETAKESSTTILTNLKRAADLVQSFKQVAVDQTAGEAREFKLHDLVNEIMVSLRPKYKRTSHRVEVDIPENLTMYSYPGDIMQLVTNLVMNSFIHAFEDMENGLIIIKSRLRDENTVQITISDNGRGVSQDAVKKLFDPFYTTKRGHGGTGLGLHIVHNLVTQKLKGVIKPESDTGQGLKYEIIIPRDIRGGVVNE